TPRRTGSRTQARSGARGRHPTSRVLADGRGPNRPAGRRTPLFLVLFLSVSALVMLGVVMVLSASAAASLSDTSSAWSLFRRQALWTAVGAVAMFTTMRVDYRRWRVLAVPGLVLSFVLLVAVVLPGVGLTANGATRWLGVGRGVFQPSEAAKLAFVVFAADLLARRPIERSYITFRPVVAVAAATMGLLMIEPHLGAAIIIGVIALSMLFFAGTSLLRLAAVGAASVSFAYSMVISSPWRRARLLGYLDPWADPLGNGYQPLQSLHAVSVGGLSGVGLGASRAKWGFLPYAHTDFIFAVIGEELGLLGAGLVVVLFITIGAAGFLTALRAPDRFGLLLAAGVTTWILAQAVLNMGAVLALLPVLGVTLPFLSFGGSSLVVTMAALGLLLNIARQAR
ncbi:MAG: putative lipid II flippase FtsW, partial [Acidimicrobiales bacterium]